MFVWPAGSPDAGRLSWGNQSDSSQDGWCGRATVRNTDRVVVRGKGRSGRLDFQLLYLPFAPGRTAGAGTSEIEFVLRGGMDGFWMTGLGGPDGECETVRVGERGVDVNGDGDVDVRFRSRVANLYLFLLGGPGDDVLTSTGGASWLLGGAGDDVLDGGPGDDQAWSDDDDPPSGIEARLVR